MTKHDWIWIAIRVFGIYLLVLAVIAIPGVMSSAFGLYQTFPIVHSSSADEDLSRTLRSTMGSELINALARLFICGFVGIYLARGGTWLFRILCPADSESKHDKV